MEVWKASTSTTSSSAGRSKQLIHFISLVQHFISLVLYNCGKSVISPHWIYKLRQDLDIPALVSGCRERQDCALCYLSKWPSTREAPNSCCFEGGKTQSSSLPIRLETWQNAEGWERCQVCIQPVFGRTKLPNADVYRDIKSLVMIPQN